VEDQSTLRLCPSYLGNGHRTIPTQRTVAEHIKKSVYNPNLRIVPYLDDKIRDPDKIALRKIIEFTRFKYFTSFDVDYTSGEFPVVTNHCELPIFTEYQESVVLKYITTSNGFKNIEKKEYIENDWQMKKVKYLPEVEKMYSNFMKAK
jgi:hypothetical protein